MATNLYETLEVSKDATPEQIRKAYKRKALQTHPDRLQPGTSQEEKTISEELFRKVNSAYEVLTDTQNRRLYDLYGVWPPPGPQAVPPPRTSSESYRSQARHRQPSRNEFFSDFSMFDHHPFPGFTDPFLLFDSIFGDSRPDHARRHRHPSSWFASELSRMTHDDFNDPFGGFSPFGFPTFGAQLFSQDVPSFSDGGSGTWKSERYITRSINGVTQTLHQTRDWNGDEHITRTYPDGQEIYTINGVEQPSSRGYIAPANQPETRRLLPATSSRQHRVQVQPVASEQTYYPPPPYPGNVGGHHSTTAVAAPRQHYSEERQRSAPGDPYATGRAPPDNRQKHKWWSRQ